jgi:simple sugar transport system substrate-binding protein
MSSRKFRRGLAAALAFGVFAAWSQAAPNLASATGSETTPPSDSATSDTDPVAADSTTPGTAALAEVPPQFADGSVNIALVAQLSAGDYFEQWRAGAEAQAEELGITLDFLGADGDNDRHALNLQQAIDNDADAIIVDHGFPETIQPVIGQAVEAGIPVVAFDVDPGEHEVVTLSQSDEEIAGTVLEVLGEDTGGEGEVIYVYVSGFAPLDRRDAVWQQFKQDNPGITEVAQIGVVSDNTAAQVAEQAKAALQANPDVTAIFAPYDEFAKGAVQAVQELGLEDQVRVYGADISNADIAVITAEGSPWVATSATDPSNVGAVAVRAAALLAAGEDVPQDIVVPPALITQQQLRDGNIQNISELIEVVPELNTPDLVPIPWLG